MKIISSHLGDADSYRGRLPQRRCHNTRPSLHTPSVAVKNPCVFNVAKSQVSSLNQLLIKLPFFLILSIKYVYPLKKTIFLKSFYFHDTTMSTQKKKNRSRAIDIDIHRPSEAAPGTVAAFHAAGLESAAPGVSWIIGLQPTEKVPGDGTYHLGF